MRRALTLVAAIGAMALPLAAAADETKADRLSTTVRGHAVAAADELSIELTVSESAESADDAERRYRETIGAVLAALGKGDPKQFEGKRKPKKRASEEETPKPKRAPAAEDDDDETPPPPKKKPAKKPAKKTDESNDDDDPAPTPKKKKADEDGAKPEKKDEAKKDDAKKDDAKKDDEKDAPAIAVDVREGATSISVRTPDPNQVRMRRMGVNQPGPKEEPQVRFSSTITISLKDISKLDPKVVRKQFAQLIDKAVAKGAELGFGPDGDSTPAVIKFSVRDPDALKKKAYEDAMRQANDRGGELAKLAGRALGRVVVVRDNTQPQQPGGRKTLQPWNTYGYQPVQLLQGEDVVMDVAVDVDLYVEFELK